MLKIVFLDADTLGTDISLGSIAALGDFVTYGHTHQNEVIARLDGAQIAITNKVVIGEHEMRLLPHLKLICVAATGTNNIDLTYAKQRGIIVKNAVNYSSQSVTQHTFACLLALMGQIAWHDHYVKNGTYSKSLHFTNLSHPYEELANKTFGIIGMGNIGRQVAEVATAFGAKVVFASVTNPDAINRIEKYEHVSLDVLLQTSDVVSIHSPLNEKTRNLIDKSRMQTMRKGAILVNMGRGGIVVEQDLVYMLNEGHLGGACLDVFEREPIEEGNPLLGIKDPSKVIMTPHIAWASREARLKLIQIIAGHIEEFKK